MIDEKFKKLIEEGKGCAVIMAGSGSDRPHIEKIVKSLKEYEIPHEVRVCSAHKQPDKLKELIDEYNEVDGLVAYIAVAGGTDALSGTLSFHALGPVISCPPDTRLADKEKYSNNLNETGLANPPGSSNAYIGRSQNVGKFIAQMYAGVNEKYRKLLEEKNASKINSLEQVDAQFRKEFGGK